MTRRRKLIFTLVVFAACLAGAELALRLLKPQYHEFVRAWFTLARRTGVSDWDLRPDQSLRFRVAWPDSRVVFDFAAHTDEQGLRTAAPGRPAVDRDSLGRAKRVVHCIGDSYTYGFGVEFDEAYPAQLAERLGDSHAVVNLGAPAIGLCRSVARGRRLEVWRKPDVLVYLSGGDFGDDDGLLSQAVNDAGVLVDDRAPSRLEDAFWWLLRSSYVAASHQAHFARRDRRLVMDLLKPALPAVVNDEVREVGIAYSKSFARLEDQAQHRTLRALATLAADCRERQIELICVVLLGPSLEIEPTVTAMVAEELGLRTIRFIPQRDWILDGDMHFTPEGNRQLAELIYREAFAGGEGAANMSTPASLEGTLP